MLQLSPPLPTSMVERVLGLTPWMLTSDEPPPFLGWWKTLNMVRTERRWWSGTEWSTPVLIGSSEAVCIQARMTPTPRDSQSIYWCGLQREHIAGYYDYPLVKTPRLVAWEKLHVPV